LKKNEKSTKSVAHVEIIESTTPCRRIVPVVLAGGTGTPLWPMAHKNFPKQSLNVMGTDTLLNATLKRMKGFPVEWQVSDTPIVTCGEEHRFVTAEQLRDTGVEACIVIEPVGRDTAPALTLAALLACADGEDGILVTMPADHSIADTESLQRAISHAASYAEDGFIATLGVQPTRPDTGFGYIKLGDTVDGRAYQIAHFIEKPDGELAEQYVSLGTHWWNSGIFVVRATVWLTVLKRLQPEMYEACLAAFRQSTKDGSYFRPDAEQFARAPSDSIDYAVMELLGTVYSQHQGVVVPLEAGWSDLGSWDAVWSSRTSSARRWPRSVRPASSGEIVTGV